MLVIFDVDSTLIEQEVIEILAGFSGRRSEVEGITSQAMGGELDFEASLRARVKLLEGLPEQMLDQALESCTVTSGALELISAIHNAGGKSGAVSGGFSQILKPLAQRLNLDFHLSNELEITNGYLTGRVTGPIIDKPAKAKALIEWSEFLGVHLRNTVAIGDGANDLDMMKVAGLSIGFNAKPRVRAAADILVSSGDLRDVLGLIGL
jgi:phosphoserine phosphatase